MTTTSYEAHAKYTGTNFTVATKTLLASALDHTALLGGYGIHSVDSKNGKQEYTAFRQSTSWINFTYGQHCLSDIPRIWEPDEAWPIQKHYMVWD